MIKAGDKIKTDIWKKAAETPPKDEWICPECKSKNTNWMADLSLLLKDNKIEFRHGLCDNCRRLVDKEIEKENELEKKKELNIKITALLNASQIPPKVLGSTFNNLEIRKGAELAFRTMEKMDKADRWIYIHGDNDTGKSTLTGATVNKLAKKLIPCYYFNERTLFKRFKDAMDNKNNESAYSIFNNLKKADIIFWDDFSVFDYSTWEMGVAYDILEFCDQYYKKVVFISNIDLKNDLATNKTKTDNRIGKRNIARMKRNKIFYIKMKNKPFN